MAAEILVLKRRMAVEFCGQLFAWGVLCGFALVGVVSAAEQATEQFETQIRPLLIEHCSACHTGAKQEGGLKLESRADLLLGGDSGSAVNLEQPEQSLLLKAVRRSEELAMPPKYTLSQQQVAAIESWLQQGAPWPETSGKVVSVDAERARKHWAFQPVVDPHVPTVADVAWVQNPVDAFILSRLEQAELTPSAAADRRTLIRRLYYHVTGLPPTGEQVREFVANNDPAAYARLVDELLNAPEYGEHWARHWLDVARYADTKGYVYAREERFWTHAWTYRDWVVNALNRDLPYDQFLRLQIAADQVEGHAPEDLAAMGFLTLGRRFLGVPWDIIDDRIDTVCRGTMGLTVACARCHDHKYDPIPTADYYSLYGVFGSSEERLVRLPSASTAAEIEAEYIKRQTALTEKLQASQNEASARARSRVKDYLHAQTELEKYPAQGFDQIFEKDDLLPAFVRRWQAYLYQAEQNNDPVFVAWRRYQALPVEQFAQQAIDVTRQLELLSDVELNPLVRQEFLQAPESFEQVIERYAALLTDIDGQWQTLLKESAEGTQPPGGLVDPAAEMLRRVLYGPQAPCEVPAEPVVHTETFFDSGTLDGLWKLQGEVDRWVVQSGEQLPHALTLVERSELLSPRIMRRGNPLSLGEAVPRQFLSLLSGPERQPFQQGSGRRELAEAIVAADNPLTARVLVNRVWAHHFGQGLVLTPSDFGLRAAPPSHPELLDWLATRFVDEGWSLKKLHRLILLSSTFQQTSTVTGDVQQLVRARQLDPENRLLWRMHDHRLSFEEFRDSALAVSGDLERRPGGKPTEIFAAPYPRRRTLYGLIDRQFLPSTLRMFDFANPDLHIPQRSDTTVPQQSLFLMNHPLVLERVRALAAAVAQEQQPQQKVALLFQRVLQRDPSTDELAEALAFVDSARVPAVVALIPTAADWQYGYGVYGDVEQRTVGFTPLPHFTGAAWQGGPGWPDASLGWAQLTATGGHPGNDRQHAVVRRWTAPRTMKLQVASKLVNEPAAGDGIRAFIVSSRAGLLKSVKNHQQPMELSVDQLDVEAGETLDFIVDIDEMLNSDQFLWEIHVRELSNGTVWNSREDFPQNTLSELDGWEQLAQALLCTNEFLFVD